MELRERLENSFHFAMTTVDKMLLDLCWCDSTTSLFSTLNNMHIQPHLDSIRWASLRDNRDLEVSFGNDDIIQGNIRLRFNISDKFNKLCC